MKHSAQHVGMGLRIAIGFVIVLVLMVSLGAIGLGYVAQANQRLKNIAHNNNVKTELATEMHSALRERALAMHALPILADAFDKDSEIQRFNTQGALYSQARQRLESMPLSAEEGAILERIRGLTREAQPVVQSVMELSASDNDQVEIFERIRNVAMLRQRAIAEQVGALLALQRSQTASAVHEAQTSYVWARDLMLALGTAALMIGMAIAWYVSQRVSLQARQLAAQALYDPLTGLANRSLLHHRIAQEIERSRHDGSSFGVALMDLDRFKEVNDSLGHGVGDELLCEVGRRLKAAVRAEDTVARLGGDEYVVVLHGLDAKGASETAHKLLAALDSPFRWHDQSIDLGASVGISLYPAQCADVSALLRCADVAMYVAKKSGKGHALYAPEQERAGRSNL